MELLKRIKNEEGEPTVSRLFPRESMEIFAQQTPRRVTKELTEGREERKEERYHRPRFC